MTFIYFQTLRKIYFDREVTFRKLVCSIDAYQNRIQHSRVNLFVFDKFLKV